jgi:hypothetical protein
MNIATTKKAASAAAALVLAGALFGASATAANAAYPAEPKVTVKVTAPAKSVTVGKKYVVKGTSVKGAKVVVTYKSTKSGSKTKTGDKATLKKTGTFSTDFKIKTTGTYKVTVKVTAAGKKTFTKTYTVKVKK